METFKILIVTPDYPPSIGGIQTITLNLEKGLKKIGHEVELLHLDPRNFKSDAPFRDYLFSKATFKRYFFLPFHSRTYHNLVYRKTNEIRSKFKPDITHVMHASMFSAIYGCAEPSVISCHALEIQNNFSVRYSLTHATKIHAVSNFTKSLITDIVNREYEIKIIYHSIDFESFKLNNTIEKKDNIITVCRLVKRKNIDTVLRSLTYLPKNLRDKYDYVIVGDGPERPKLEQLKNALGLDNVVFKGEITDSEKIALLCQSKLFVMCPLQIGLDVEGFGIVFIEANAAGLPVVASKTGGVPEAVGNGGIFVDDETDPKEIAKKIEELLIDEEKYNQIKKYALERVKKFDNERITKEFVELYRGIIYE